MDQNLQEILNSMEAAATKVAELEAQLGVAKEEGRKLFELFQRRQKDLASKFSKKIGDAFTAGPTGKVPRRSRSVASNIAVGGSRMVTNAAKDGRSASEARKLAMERALELAKKNGLTTVPEEAVTMIEATVRKRYPKSR